MKYIVVAVLSILIWELGIDKALRLVDNNIVKAKEIVQEQTK
jgi:hypothetical protein